MFEFLSSGILQASGAIMQADEQAKSLNQEADAQDQNAQIAVMAGKYNIMRQQMSADKTIGGIKAGYGASGITSDSGSVMDILRESHINAELDRMNIKYGADMTALNAKSRATALRQSAKSAKKMGQFNAFSALFSAGAQEGMRGGGGGSSASSGNVSTTSSGSSYGSAGGSYSDTGSIS